MTGFLDVCGRERIKFSVQTDSKRRGYIGKMRSAGRMLLYLSIHWVLGMEMQGVEARVPALFVFGDSLLDTGNNNYLLTDARARSPPYGVDYHNGTAGGRFSNGLITTDFIASSLDLPTPPPYMSAGDNVERGVNFASAGSGILDSTGDFFGQHFGMGQQISNFGRVQSKLVQKLGKRQALLLISKAIFYITVGSNDYLVTYYSIPRNPLYAFYSREQFADELISTFVGQLKTLYSMGARKFAVTALPNIGCMPFALRLYTHPEGKCVAFLNEDAMAYNAKFFATLQGLQAQHPSARFVYNNAYDAAFEVYNNSRRYGIVNVKNACCNLGNSEMGVCLRGFRICPNASQYFFFDGFHPTTAVHQLTANFFISGSPPMVRPFNLQKLAATF